MADADRASDRTERTPRSAFGGEKTLRHRFDRYDFLMVDFICLSTRAVRDSER